jgi:hypothetical protein
MVSTQTLRLGTITKTYVVGDGGDVNLNLFPKDVEANLPSSFGCNVSSNFFLGQVGHLCVR